MFMNGNANIVENKNKCPELNVSINSNQKKTNFSDKISNNKKPKNQNMKNNVGEWYGNYGANSKTNNILNNQLCYDILIRFFQKENYKNKIQAMNYPPPPQNTQVYPPTEQTMMEMKQNQQQNPQQYVQQYPDQYPQQNQPPIQPYDQNQQYNPDPYNQQQWPEYHQPYYHGNFAAYGDFYFTPVMMKNNVPVKQDSSLHVPVIVVSIIFWAGIVVAGAGASNFLDAVATGLIIGLTYLLYLIISICCSDVRGYITNLKRFDEYKSMYDKMVNGRGYFHFWIQCYHYRTTRDSKGRTRRTKVVTHTASKKYEPKECFDDSGAVTGIQDVTKYVFLNYLKKFYFTDEKSAKNYDNAWNSFVAANRRDTHQDTSRTFEIQGFEPEVGFCAMGEGHNSCLFYVITFLGLALPYACILERSVSRYSLNIVKRLTC